MNRILLFALVLLPSALHAQGAGTFTMIEGSIRVLRGTSVFVADRKMEGMRLQNNDIVETSSPGFVQVEFSGGTIAAIGPSTRVLLRSSGGPELVVMSGWVKGETSAGSYRLASPLMTATAKAGAVNFHAGADGADAYIETGTATISEGEGKVIPGKTGQFFSRHGGKNIAVAPRPDGAFVNAMPVPFRDTLPARASHFAGKKPPEPKMDHEVTYAEAEPWLRLGRGWRRSFSERFQPRLKDAEFRKSVEQHISEYPEWDRVLHPEKYEKSPNAPSTASTPPPGSY
jgi:hypothetical protein